MFILLFWEHFVNRYGIRFFLLLRILYRLVWLQHKQDWLINFPERSVPIFNLCNSRQSSPHPIQYSQFHQPFFGQHPVPVALVQFDHLRFGRPDWTDPSDCPKHHQQRRNSPHSKLHHFVNMRESSSRNPLVKPHDRKKNVEFSISIFLLLMTDWRFFLHLALLFFAVFFPLPPAQTLILLFFLLMCVCRFLFLAMIRQKIIRFIFVSAHRFCGFAFTFFLTCR